VEFLGSTKNQLLENRIEGNGRSGITLSYQSNNNLIAGNNVVDNGFATVDLQNAQNNTFYRNNFRINIEIRNGIYRTHQILDMHANDLVTTPFTTPSHNIWDNGSQGNHWSDYKGTDADNDGIGDTPHVVDTSPHAEPVIVYGKNYWVEAIPDIDRYPLASPFNFTVETQIVVSEPASSLYKASDVSLAFTLADSRLRVRYSLDQKAELEANVNTTLSGLSSGAHFLLLWTTDDSGTPANFQIIPFEVYQEISVSPSQTPEPTQQTEPTREEPVLQAQNEDGSISTLVFTGSAVAAATVVVLVLIKQRRRQRKLNLER
jgi:parallel beta-helix repeat protein